MGSHLWILETEHKFSGMAASTFKTTLYIHSVCVCLHTHMHDTVAKKGINRLQSLQSSERLRWRQGQRANAGGVHWSGGSCRKVDKRVYEATRQTQLSKAALYGRKAV